MNNVAPIAKNEIMASPEPASIMEVISRAAADPNTDVSKLERLLGMYERRNVSIRFRRNWPRDASLRSATQRDATQRNEFLTQEHRMHPINKLLGDIARANEPRFANVSCSQCGEDFGPGDHGFSSCEAHRPQRKIITTHINPPIPVRQFDWSAVRDGYEPGDPIGYGPTEADAKQDLIDQEAA